MRRSLLLVVCWHGCSIASAADLPADFFEKTIRPILVESCHSCHSQTAGKKKGGLVLDSLAGLLKGGDTGPAVVPGKPDESLLVKAIRHTDSDLRMPPKRKLAAAEVAALEQWVKAGAPWPGAAGAARAPGKITDEERRWWAFQPLSHATPPEVDDARWSGNPIDRFIHARLKAEGLAPAPPAEAEALIRRIYFDLIGLPPNCAEIEEFKKASLRDSASAVEQLTDRLLASPRYGERWARHWLDLVRYAESDGFRVDDYRPDAWHYRDYVIRSFQADKPYDRFVQEQLAGDELWPDDVEARTATGFLRHGIYEYNQRDVRTQWDNILNDLTDTTGEVFLGLGMGCARCHDHKFDPILQRDYYRLQAFFAPMLPRDGQPLATAEEVAAHREKQAQWEAMTADCRAEIERIEEPVKQKAAAAAIDRFPAEIQAMIRKPVAERTALEHQLAELAYRQVLWEFDRIDKKLKDPEKARWLELKKQLAELDADKPAPLPLARTVSDVATAPPQTFIPRKTKLGAIEPGFLSLFDEAPANIEPVASAPTSTGRRTALARWIARPDNGLTMRVIVNRVWQDHFGKGLVATASDFGRLGEKPSHPELLDWLAGYFASSQDGPAFTFKKLHRLIVTSAAYRQSATAPVPPTMLMKDPGNRLLGRMTSRRLDAEQIRDALLMATGELDLTTDGPGVEPSQPRRSIYCRWMRNTRDPLLDVFDLPEGFTSTAQRNITTTPTQALFMINSGYVLARARALADRLHREKQGGDAQLADAAFRLTLGRVPAAPERRRVLQFLQGRPAQAERKGPSPALVDLCHVLLNTNEFLFVD